MTTVPEELQLEDLTWALSKVRRYTGHTMDTEGYSVAQHSLVVMCFMWMSPNPETRTFALEGLFHDLQEAITNDMSTPMKRCLTEFGPVEDRLQALIAKKFGLVHPDPPCVKVADLQALRLEMNSLIPGGVLHLEPKLREFVGQLPAIEVTPGLRTIFEMSAHEANQALLFHMDELSRRRGLDYGLDPRQMKSPLARELARFETPTLAPRPITPGQKTNHECLAR